MKLAATGLLACASAAAQCAMCRTAASAQSGEAARTLDLAILVLLAPAVVMFCGIFAGIFRTVSKSDE